MNCEWLEITKTAGTIVVGIAASFIAYQQHKTNKDKLRLDLFEKRFALYNSLYESWIAIINGRENSIGISDNNKIYRESLFLFGKEITSYIREFFRKLFTYGIECERLESMNKKFRESHIDNPERIPLITKTEKARADLHKEMESLEEVFRPYLHFGVKI